MKILITGCAGFIGSHLTEALLASGHSVVGIDNFDAFYPKEQKLRNLSDAQKNKNFSFHEIDICHVNEFEVLPQDADIVIHLAAKAGVRPSIMTPKDYIDTNITGTFNILEWMVRHGIKKMVFGSSSSVYGNNKKIPFSESDNVDKPISPYAFTKKAAELLTYNYHHLYKLDIINLRFFTVYGPRQRPDLAIRKFIEKIKVGEPIHLFGDGSTARDYTFVSDIVDGIISAMHFVNSNTNVYETINLGNNSPVKLNDMVSCIYKTINAKPNLVYSPMQPGDVDITYADISKAGRLLNYKPKVSFEEGIKKFVDWLEENGD